MNNINARVACLQITGGNDVDLEVSGGVQMNKHLIVQANVHSPSVYLSDPVVDSLQATTKQYVDNFRFIGDIKYSLASDDHQGWLKCDGRSMLRNQYTQLFNVIGTQFGSSDGAHFNLPDCRGRVLGSAGSGSGLTTRNIGSVVGEENHTMSLTELPSHTHSGTTDSNGAHSHSVTDPGHTHTQTTINDDFNNSGANPPGFTSDSAGSRTWNNINSSTTGISIVSNGSHTHTFTTGSTGSGNSFNVMQPTIFISNVFVFSGEEEFLD